MRKTLIIMPLLLLGISAAAQPKLGKADIDKVIAAMTVEEKINLVVGSGGNKSAAASATVGDFGALVPGAAGQTNAIPRLGIPATTLADGPAGLRIDPTRTGTKRTFYCTHFPVEMLMSATWNTALMEEVGVAIGYETLHYGADVLLAPATNIMRNPLCGRNFEYLSEDPLLAGKMCAAEIRGLQSNGIGVSVKHFALNNQETNRTGNDARVSERAMEEIYLKPFEIAIKEGKPWTVMSSYNRINGTMSSESKWLLEDRLRRDWGFDGLVMSDWYGGTDPVAMLKAGNDLLMPGNKKQVKALNKALEKGTITIKDLDRNVKRILEYILKTPAFNDYKADNEPSLEAHAAITRTAATEGMVLLKNNMVLPMDGCKAAVFGRTSYNFIAGGTGSGDVHHAYVVDLIQGLQNAGFTIDADLEKTYRAYIKKKDKGQPKGLKALLPADLIPEMPLDGVDLLGIADENDVAVITVGKTSGEFEDRSITSNYYLTDDEISMITKVCGAFHSAGKKVIVILNVCGVVDTISWIESPDAVLCAWLPGQEGGNSVADILTGKANPSGRLPMTWPRSYKDVPSAADFPDPDKISRFKNMKSMSSFVGINSKPGRTKNFDYTEYNDDIFVGYRHYTTNGVKVSFPFGFGLSYTTFEYSDPVLKGGSVFVTVRNTGGRAGKEVVQVYSASDRTGRPARELVGFTKTELLQEGESQTVEIPIYGYKSGMSLIIARNAADPEPMTVNDYSLYR